MRPHLGVEGEFRLAAAGPAARMTAMRLATFNILHGRSPDDDRVDLGRFASAVRDLDADILALQEVDRDQPRSGGADLTAVAAEAMRAVDHRFVAALAGTPGAVWTAATGEEQPGSAAYGVALLSRYPVRSWRRMPLPALRTPVPLRVASRRMPIIVRDEPRVAVTAVVRTPTGDVTVAATHLSFVPGWNAVQLRRLVGELRARAGRLVVMGDLNMGPAQARRLTGMRPLAGGLTFPAEAPSRQLDHILGRGPLPLHTTGTVHRLPLSDHRALSVDL
jgi:endonuclease/exonuclease/phosphatase family metal-dependent hydrolase